MKALNYNIGAGDTHCEGWESLDIKDDILLIGKKAAKIYASHFIEYFDEVEIMQVLKYWYDAMIPNGELYLAVPDFEAITRAYNETGVILTGPLYGKMNTPSIYHKTVFDFVSLRHTLLLSGFRKVREFEPIFDDCSRAEFKGIKLSLNLKCMK